MISVSNRLYYLDALRSFAILYGILLHVLTLGVPSGLRWIHVSSGYFRMSLFFLVSGFFASMMLKRYTTQTFLRRRSVALLVPLVTGLILLNPITNWLVATYHNGPVPFSTAIFATGGEDALKGPAVWHLHLWFLITLFFFVATAPMITVVGRNFSTIGHWIASRLAILPPTIVILIIAFAIAISSTVLRAGYSIAMAPLLRDTPLSWIGQTTMYYWPFYVMGMIFFTFPTVAERFQSVSVPALIVGIILAALAPKIFNSGVMGDIVRVISKSFCTTTVVAILMAVFRRFLNRPTFLSETSEYVYSIYIMHFLVIYVIAFSIRPLNLDSHTTFITVAAVTYLIVFTLHRYVIKPTPILEFFLNGKPMTVSSKSVTARSR